MPVTYAKIDKARRLLGYNPTTKIEAGIERFVEWFKKQPLHAGDSEVTVGCVV